MLNNKEHEFFIKNSELINQYQKPKSQPANYFATKHITKSILIGRYQPYEIIGAEEVMIDATQRFVTAKWSSDKAVMFRLKKSDLK